jgi:hypothetical protein
MAVRLESCLLFRDIIAKKKKSKNMLFFKPRLSSVVRDRRNDVGADLYAFNCLLDPMCHCHYEMEEVAAAIINEEMRTVREHQAVVPCPTLHCQATADPSLPSSESPPFPHSWLVAPYYFAFVLTVSVVSRVGLGFSG